jgi:hypothetical protein
MAFTKCLTHRERKCRLRDALHGAEW